MQMTRNDYLSAKSFLRWSGIGIAPSVERAKATLDVVRETTLESIKAIAQDVMRGMMVSQDSCNAAVKDLDRAYQQQKPSDDDAHDVEQDRG